MRNKRNTEISWKPSPGEAMKWGIILTVMSHGWDSMRKIVFGKKSQRRRSIFLQRRARSQSVSGDPVISGASRIWAFWPNQDIFMTPRPFQHSSDLLLATTTSENPCLVPKKRQPEELFSDRFVTGWSRMIHIFASSRAGIPSWRCPSRRCPYSGSLFTWVTFFTWGDTRLFSPIFIWKWPWRCAGWPEQTSVSCFTRWICWVVTTCRPCLSFRGWTCPVWRK